VSICLSKGLGAPIGSLLLGDKDFITEARRVRKLYGGGMRQSGYLAAAGIFALQNNIDRLKEDHHKARELGSLLATLTFVKEVMPVDTNILIFKLVNDISEKDLLDRLRSKGILAIGFGPQTVRMVTHLDFSGSMLQQTMKVLKSL
jgi:threonine aldolase